MLWTIRQPRYAKMSAAMVLVFFVCIAAGTWQIERFSSSVHGNNALRGNAHAPVSTLGALGVHLTGDGKPPSRDAVTFHRVRVVGTYVQEEPQFVQDISVGGSQGFWVLSPVRTGDSIVLVVRGFVAATADGSPPHVGSVPIGQVQLVGRVEPTSTSDDATDQVNGQVEVASINASQQSTRLHAPVAQAYVLLQAHQAGTAGLVAVPDPDLSNPVGGAPPWQHFAYIVQWYLFALLALCAPFAMRRHDVREAQRQYLGLDTDSLEYGLETPVGRKDLPGDVPTGTIAVRGSGSLVRIEDVVAARWTRAERLADRYGRAVSVTGAPSPEVAQALARQVIAAADGSASLTQNGLNRSADEYHAAYNDHLWQLAMADGETPDIIAGPVDSGPSPEILDAAPRRAKEITGQAPDEIDG